MTQYWFCHTTTWIHHGCTHVPNPEPHSHLPPHTIPLGHPSAPAPSFLYPASNLDWQFISPMILYMFQCHSPKSSHPLPLPQSPKDFYTSVSLLLSCIQGYRYHLSKFHIYALVYCIGVFLSGLLQPPVPYLLGKNHLKSKLDSGACASCRFSRFQITGKINLYTDSNSSRDWKKRWKNEYNFKVSTKSPQILRFLIWN